MRWLKDARAEAPPDPAPLGSALCGTCRPPGSGAQGFDLGLTPPLGVGAEGQKGGSIQEGRVHSLLTKQK